jgi:hypothetical protein
MKTNEDTVATVESSSRRRFVKVVGVLGTVGLAGCGADDDATDTPTEGGNGNGNGGMTDTATETGGNGNGNGNGNGDTPTDTTATETEEPTSTPEPSCSLPEDPPQLLTFDGVSGGTLSVLPDQESITAQIQNPYLFEIRSGEVTLDVPGDWEVTGVEGNAFETLSSGGSQEVEWSVSVPSTVAEFTITANVTYENCDGTESADVQIDQNVLVDPYAGDNWETLATAPEYYDALDPDQEDPPGNPSGVDNIDLELDLSAYAGAEDFRLKFSDYWPSDGWGALVERTIITDGEGNEIHNVEADTEAELDYIVENSGSQRWSEVSDAAEDETWRFADRSTFWVYEFSVPDGTQELTATITIRNQFVVEGRKGLERSE